MRIGIDIHAAEREGTGNCTYIRNLVEALLEKDRDDEFFLYASNPSHAYFRRFDGSSHVRLRSLHSGNALVRIPALGLKTFLDKIDILHVQYVAPPLHRGKCVVAVHDISYLHYPECFRRTDRLYLKTFVPMTMKRAAKVLTISEHSRKDIIANYLVAPAKTTVTSLGVDPAFKPLEGPEVAEVMGSYGVSGPFLLFIGRLDVRKNIAALIRAFRALKQQKSVPHRLVISGKKDFLPKPLQDEFRSMPEGEDVVFTGYIPQSHLPAFYSAADVFVYPSLYEGFGLPCLEAMACGCPVVAADSSSIPEVVGSAGLLVDPQDVEGLASALGRVLSDPGLRNEMRVKGRERARLFTWGRAAEQTLKVYREIGRR